MRKNNYIKFLLLMNLFEFCTLFSMQESAVVKDIGFLEIPNEIRIKIIEHCIENTVFNNEIYDPFKGLDIFLIKLSHIDSNFRNLIKYYRNFKCADRVNDKLIDFAKLCAKKKFAQEESKLDSCQLENDFKKLLIDKFNKLSKLKFAKLIIAGVNLKTMINECVDSTLLFKIAVTGKCKKLIKLLISYGLDLTIKDEANYDALLTATLYGNADVVEILLKHKDVNVNIQNKWRQSPLMIAAENNNIAILRLLLKRNDLDVNLKNNSGITALMLAALNDSVEFVEILLSVKNLDINLQSNFGDTALIFACAYGHKQVVKLLMLKKELDINLVNNNRQDAVYLAFKNNHFDIRDMLNAFGKL